MNKIKLFEEYTTVKDDFITTLKGNLVIDLNNHLFPKDSIDNYDAICTIYWDYELDARKHGIDGITADIRNVELFVNYDLYKYPDNFEENDEMEEKYEHYSFTNTDSEITMEDAYKKEHFYYYPTSIEIDIKKRKIKITF